MDHITKTIETLETQIADHEREAQKLRIAINTLCDALGMPRKYDTNGGCAHDLLSIAGKSLSVRPDQFYNKSLSSAVKDALNMLRTVNRAPASVESIYDLLKEGGFEFDSKARDSAITSLSISIGKNSALFAKLPNGLIAVKEWYGAPRRAGRTAKDGDADENLNEQPASDPGEQQQPAQESAT